MKCDLRDGPGLLEPAGLLEAKVGKRQGNVNRVLVRGPSSGGVIGGYFWSRTAIMGDSHTLKEKRETSSQQQEKRRKDEKKEREKKKEEDI